MRKANREVTDLETIKTILSEAHVIHLGINDDKYPYVVPTNYGFEMQDDGHLTLYSHGAPVGKKRELISRDGHIAFEIDNGGHLMVPENSSNPSDYSFAYQSIMGVGNAQLVTDVLDKKKAMQTILLHETGKEWPNIDASDINYVGVIKIDVQRYTAKQHLD